MNSLPSNVTIVEVGPRDGLQNEAQHLSAQVKIDFINQLSCCGLAVIESGSMVNPEWLPQMANSEEVIKGIHQRPGIKYPVLVPNEKGMQRALEAGAKSVAIFISASEGFNHKNLNCSIEQSFTHFDPVMAIARDNGIEVRAYLSCVMGCPFDGKVKPMVVATIARRLIELGCYEVSLGDTIGIGTPLQAQRLIQAVSKQVAIEQLAIHFHNTRGQALANIYACLELGITTIDAAVAGLGGCPYTDGSSGNIATEDVIYMLHGMGIETGVDLRALSETGNMICQQLNRINSSHVGKLYR
ncbi:MAG: hydroxymethylglutaryl-CoA lyase [Thiotrichaceae bacterium]|nr:hydroxymethylglutaryl-CoA lyase [Thiotrichaceae bacterium]PCI13924.1 MAG: hydroxymethylglutaryl-CoA lyase [Thiotrichales bacterium]